MLRFQDYINLREEDYSSSDKITGHGFTNGLAMGASSSENIGKLANALSKALADHKSRTISFLRSLNDSKINGILDEMNAGDLNRASDLLGKAHREKDEIAPNIADSGEDDSL